MYGTQKPVIPTDLAVLITRNVCRLFLCFCFLRALFWRDGKLLLDEMTTVLLSLKKSYSNIMVLLYNNTE